MNRKRNLWIVLGGVLITAVIYYAFTQTQQTNTATAQSETETAVAFIGNLSESATASGKIQAQQSASISANNMAQVAAVYVRIGDTVTVGTPLVQIDTKTLTLDITNAEQALRQAEANLANVLKPATAEDIAAAAANVNSAQASLDDLLDGPSATDIAEAEANLRASEASVWASSANVAQVQDSVTEAQLLSAHANLLAAEQQLESARKANEDNTNEDTHATLMSATQSYESALATYNNLTAGPNDGDLGGAQGDLAAAAARKDSSQISLNTLLNGPTAVQLANAQSQLAEAEKALANLQNGPTADDIASAEAQVTQAQLTLENAQRSLTEATIVAPFDGVITAVYVSEGEIASGTVVELINNSLDLVLNVDEVDIGRLATGMPTTITIETWPDAPISSEISSIAPSATSSSNSALVTYDVRLNLGTTDLPVRAGMSANASFITAENSNVLLVPNRAVNADRVNDTYSVTVIATDGTEREVAVTIGMRDSNYTQINSGLNEGDVVKIIEFTIPTESEGGFFGGPD